MSDRRFCYTTLFDSNYGAKGMSLLQSCSDQMQRSGIELKAFVLALDAGAVTVVRDHAKRFGVVEVHRIEDLFSDPVLGAALARARSDRSYRAFCWSLASIYTDHVMRMHASGHIGAGNILSYIDSDVFWFESPDYLLREMVGYSVGCQPHAFPSHELKRLGPNGKYNIGVTAFRADARGRESLSWWCNNVLMWCQEGSGDRMKWQYCGDQGYMDGVAQLYDKDFREFRNVGLYVAPWNLCEHRIEAGPRVDGVPLVAYHYHELEGPDKLSNYHLSDEAKQFIYNPYLASLAVWQPEFDRLRR
jgi:hypothetical protein